jgi:GNAT superfamily N-acetyltransferase
VTFAEASDLQKQAACNLIKNHFLRNGSNHFQPDFIKNILPYFRQEDSLLTLYYDPRFLKMKENVLKDSIPIGLITTQPISIFLKEDEIKANYVDYLCVHSNYRKKGIAEQLIQTHEFNQRCQNKNVHITLFKREGSTMFINPLIQFKSYLRNITNIDDTPETKAKRMDFKTDFNSFHDFLRNSSSLFKCRITTPQFLELLRTENIFVYLVVEDLDVLAAYFFKDTCTFINYNERLIGCIGSITSKFLSKQQFCEGFESALYDLSQTKLFSHAVIEHISHNHNFKKNTDTEFVTMSYFFYNFIHSTLRPHEVLILL